MLDLGASFQEEDNKFMILQIKLYKKKDTLIHMDYYSLNVRSKIQFTVYI